MTTLKSLVDEIINIKNEIVECHANLKNILIEKEVATSDTDKLTDLIEKTNNIACNPTIIKGTIPNISVVENSSGGFSSNPIPQVELGFKPSKVILTYTLDSFSFSGSSVNNTGGTNITITNDRTASLRVEHASATSNISPSIVLTNTGFTFGTRAVTWYIASYTIKNISYEAYLF